MSLREHASYSETGVDWLGAIPSHWRTMQIKRAAKLRSGDMIGPEAIEPEGPYPVYGGNGLRGFTSNFTHDGEFVLIGRQGALCGNVNYASGQFWASEHAVVATPALRPAPPMWLGELLGAMNLGQYSTSAAQPGLSVEVISNLIIPIPPPEERLAIAAFLGRETGKIDALVEEQRRLIELLKAKRQAVISHAVTKGLDPNAHMKPSGFEWLGDVPEHWVVTPIRSVARLESGHTPSRSRPEWWTDCTVPWFSLADIWQVRKEGRTVITETSEQVSEIGLANSSARVLPAGTVMLSRTASVGFAAIMGVDMATTQDFANWVCGPKLNNHFLLWTLRAMRPEFSRLMMGSTHNTIYMPDLAAFRMPLPPMDEQLEMVAFLQSATGKIDRLLDQATAATALLSERRAALISAAVTGKIDVRQVNLDEVAA